MHRGIGYLDQEDLNLRHSEQINDVIHAAHQLPYWLLLDVPAPSVHCMGVMAKLLI